MLLRWLRPKFPTLRHFDTVRGLRGVKPGCNSLQTKAEAVFAVAQTSLLQVWLCWIVRQDLME